MNRLLLFAIIVIAFKFSQAQTVIVEEKYVPKMEPLAYHFNGETQSLFIEKGQQQKGVSTNDVIKEIYQYTSDGNKKIIAKNSSFMSTELSFSGKTIRATEFTSLTFGKNHKYIAENKVIKKG